MDLCNIIMPCLMTCSQQYFAYFIVLRYILFYIGNRYDSNELVSVCVIPLCILPTGQSPTIGSDTLPYSRVGICVPALTLIVLTSCGRMKRTTLRPLISP